MSDAILGLLDVHLSATVTELQIHNWVNIRPRRYSVGSSGYLFFSSGSLGVHKGFCGDMTNLHTWNTKVLFCFDFFFFLASDLQKACNISLVCQANSSWTEISQDSNLGLKCLHGLWKMCAHPQICVLYHQELLQSWWELDKQTLECYRHPFKGVVNRSFWSCPL